MNTAPEIRSTLDDWLTPGAAPPTPAALQQLRDAWAALKPNLHESYHPVINDRLALVESLRHRPEPYLIKQYGVYRTALTRGNQITALDALWRAASNSDLLRPNEINGEALTGDRTAELLTTLGWS